MKKSIRGPFELELRYSILDNAMDKNGKKNLKSVTIVFGPKKLDIRKKSV